MADKKKTNLAKEIFNDLWRHKWVMALFLLNVVTALFIVHFAHMNRLAFIEQDRLLQERDELDIQWRHYLLEQRTLAEHSRVEAIVKEKLGLYRPLAKDEVVVNLQ